MSWNNVSFHGWCISTTQYLALLSLVLLSLWLEKEMKNRNYVLSNCDKSNMYIFIYKAYDRFHMCTFAANHIKYIFLYFAFYFSPRPYCVYLCEFSEGIVSLTEPVFYPLVCLLTFNPHWKIWLWQKLCFPWLI